MLVRRLDNRAVWFEARECVWLREGESCADILKDFKTTGGMLSVWKLEEAESNLTRVIAAMAATRDQLKRFDYAVFPETILSELGIKSEKQDGVTPDRHANTSWHLNLVELTTTKLEQLAAAVNRHDDLRRFQPSEVKDLLKDGLKDNHLDSAGVDRSLLAKLQ